ncbi:isoprenyl transferase [candidate division KSB1 bacterium]
MNDELINEIIQRKNIPRHVAIIMDGNGRWAKIRGLPRIEGHREGVKSVREIVNVSRKVGVEVLTLYTFSSENWKRPRKEVSALMSLMLSTIQNEIEELHRNNVKVRTIGKLEDIPLLPRKGMEKALEKTKNNTGLILNLALSYSSRIEILSAVQSIVKKCLNGQLNADLLSEEDMSNHLYTFDLRDPDLLIRTSGEGRISNFLLWQLAYTELYFTDQLWPDFREKEFLNAIVNYQSRERRFGMVSEQLNKQS